MVNQVLHEVLETLAERYIPEGRHKLLHVDCREKWISLMETLLERELIGRKMVTLTKCAIGWEALLTQKLSIQN